MIYLICFLISVLFAHQAKISKNRSGFIVWSVLSILVTVLLAGMRDVSIGIDTSNYYYGSWQRACYTNLPLWKYLKYYLTVSRGRSEVLFAAIEWIVAKTFGNYNVLLFVVHLIIVGCVYFGAFRMERHAAPELTLLLFYLLYYNHSLNIYRQYIAMSIVFLGLADIENRRHFRYLLFVLIGCMFHNTCILGLVPLLLYRALYSKNDDRDPTILRKLLTVGIIIIGVYSFIPLVRFAINMGLLSRKYLFYLESTDTTGTHLMVILFLAVEFLGILLYWKQYHRRNEKADYFVLSSFSFFMMYILASVIEYGKRIAAYFSFLNILTIGKLVKCQSNKSQKAIVAIIVVFVALVYWCYVFAYRNASQTMPYHSALHL